ncbi:MULTISPECIES: LacI family DNA-binding transcriptional regulator [Bifidobacterium]|uniref:LacI family DNA-binding transcriptional regulator n=1 Tax=Bifidobacterium asteroides TaxID=1684 RepID=A0A556RBG5_9BIFI|nr:MULTISPECIES: LacI family DNA-binding transcriptional regulator [Bifidobacterium]MBI0086342.1 LacI family DNA-binding transcriptional regulator [Bifidobacterium sp. M0404]TSJ86240.1 LacI family DNA-binding transcriptional regulator [Bifidobacterium polysaccharolyticum]
MTTMKQIAKELGVSVSSVSLVLNNRDHGRIKPTTAKQIRQTAERLGYQPNPLARSLRTSKTGLLGFISEDVATTPFAGGIIQGAQDAARASGYIMLTVNAKGTEEEEEDVAALRRYGVDGFLYAKMYNRVTTIPDYLSGSPIVLVDATDADGVSPSVEPDEYLIGVDATNALIGAGAKRIAYIGCQDPIIAQKERSRGYRQALKNAGIPILNSLMIRVGNNETALRDVEKLFDEEHPDGFFCFNDARAWYVYESAARRGLTIGRDISVVGVDNHLVLAQTMTPRLSTVALPHYEMGYWAVSQLVTNIRHEHIKMNDVPETLVSLPPLGGPYPVKIHCPLIYKESLAGEKTD